MITAIWYIITFWAGVTCGVFIAALLAAAKRGDMCVECKNAEEKLIHDITCQDYIIEPGAIEKAMKKAKYINPVEPWQ